MTRLDAALDRLDDDLNEGVFDRLKHPRARGGKFRDVFHTHEDYKQFKSSLTPAGKKAHREHPYGMSDAEFQSQLGTKTAWSTGHNHGASGFLPHPLGVRDQQYMEGYREGSAGRRTRTTGVGRGTSGAIAAGVFDRGYKPRRGL